RALLDDLAAPTPAFTVRANITPLLLEQIPRLAASLDLTPPARASIANRKSQIENLLTSAQQSQLYSALDPFLRRTDPQLWRTKQVNDLLAGIWAQGYGQIYRQGIHWLFRLEHIARVLFATLLVIATGATLYWRRRVRLRATIS